MKILSGLRHIPASDLLTVLAATTLLLGLVTWLKRGRPTKTRPPRWLVVLRLSGFGLLALIVMALTLMIVKDYQLMLTETAPAPSSVEVPADTPFTVEAVTFASPDGPQIAGWYVPPQNGATIILLHGYGGNRTAMLWHAEVLVEAGYGVLMYDERASGESGGEYRSFGWEDAADVGAALDFLGARTEGDPTQIGIAGCSIGGQIALQGAAYYPQIGAVWADGPSVILAVDASPPQTWADALSYISTVIIDGFYQWHLGIQAPRPMIDIIGEIAPRPIMLVGGGQGKTYFSSEAPHMAYYAQHAGDNAQVWIIAEAYHCDGPLLRPEEYAARMVKFFAHVFENSP